MGGTVDWWVYHSMMGRIGGWYSRRLGLSFYDGVAPSIQAAIQAIARQVLGMVEGGGEG